MYFYFIGVKCIDSKNITVNYSVSQSKLVEALDGTKIIRLAELVEEITDGTRVKREYVENTENAVKIINISDFKNGSIYPHNIKSISKDSVKEKDYVKEGDILLTAIGRSGQLAIVSNNLQDAVISSDIIRIRLIDKSKSKYLVSFLDSFKGNLILDALKTGVLNRISVSDLKEINLPQNYYEINNKTNSAFEYQKRANELYSECLTLFSDKVRRISLNFKAPKTTYVALNKIELNRFDAEYYKYFQGELYRFTHEDSYELKWQDLKDLVEIKKAIRPQFQNDTSIKYINLSNVDAELSIIKDNENGRFDELSSRIRYVLDEGEIITAKVGSATGTEKHVSAVVTERFSKMMASDAFYNIIPKRIDPYYLLFVFKQPIVLKQFECLAIGLYSRSIIRSDFENVSIPRIEEERVIATKMREYIKCMEEYYINSEIERG